MKKYFPYISGFILTFALVFTVGGFLFPQKIYGQSFVCNVTPPGGIPFSAPGIETAAECFAWCETRPGFVCTPTTFTLDEEGNISSTIDSENPSWWVEKVFQPVVLWIMQSIVGFLSLFLQFAAFILNGVIFYTVVMMSASYTEITAIDTAWGVIRDVANMAFIFILLYAAIQTILGIGSDVKKLIVKVIVVAILINFSFFFTGLVIDASNLIALLFYDSMAPDGAGLNTGIANTFMQHLNLSGLGKVGEIDISTIFTMGIMGSILILIATFVFLAVSIMLIVRYVVLIFVLILSPLAFIAFVLPALQDKAKKWKDALIGQAFFAPIYFMLTWVTLIILGGVMTAFDVMDVVEEGGSLGQLNTASPGALILFINFIVVIVFLLASLIIAKEWANKAGPGVTGMTKWAMGAAGGATLGVAGRFGRGTVGRMGAAIGDNERLKEQAVKGGVGGMAARLALATGRKTGGASFDVRATKGYGKISDATGTSFGKPSGKGGFTEFKKKQVEVEEKNAKSYGPSLEVLDQAEQEVKKHAEGSPERQTAQIRLDKLKGVSKKEAPDKIKEVLANDPIIKRKEQIEQDLEKKQREITETETSEMVALKQKELEKMKEVLKAATDRAKIRTDEVEKMYKEGIKNVAQERKEKYANVVGKSIWKQVRGYNTAAAAQIRKGKSEKDKFAEAARDFIKKEDEASRKEEGTEEPKRSPETPPSAPPAGGIPPTP